MSWLIGHVLGSTAGTFIAGLFVIRAYRHRGKHHA